jgi:hypothetical protein
MDKIKYAVWGTKRGRSVFFHSPELESGIINDTLGDIRGAVTISEPDCNYYSLEFTINYKVYSQYYPVNDALGRPGFLAVTLYIPHGLKIDPTNVNIPNDVLALLNNMVNMYRRNYVNSESRMINNVRENVSAFDNEVAKVRTISDDDEYIGKESAKSNSDKIIRYKSIDDLKKYFDMPYQDEYFKHHQILFITAELKQAFKEEMILNFPPPQPPTYRIVVTDSEGSNILVGFTVNGETRYEAENLRLFDRVNIFAQKLYYYDFSYPSDKTVAEIIRENGLTNKDRTIRLNLVFIPMQKVIEFTVHDKDGRQLDHAVIRDEACELEVIENKVTLKGSQLGKCHSILVEATEYKSFKKIIDQQDLPDDKLYDRIVVTLEKLETKQEKILLPSKQDILPEVKTVSDTISIYVVVDGDPVTNVEIYEGNILWGKTENGFINVDKSKLDKTVTLTIKTRKYDDVHKTVTINKEPYSIQLTKDDVKVKSQQSPTQQSQSQSPTQSQPQSSTQSPKERNFKNFFNRYVVWIVAVVMLLALACFLYKLFLEKSSKQSENKHKTYVIRLIGNDNGKDTVVKMNAMRDTIIAEVNGDTINGNSNKNNSVHFSKNRDTITFDRNDTSLKVTVIIRLSNKKYGNMLQYKDTLAVISVSHKDSVQIIRLKENDTIIKINHLRAKLDSTSISYGDIKKIDKLISDKRIKFDSTDTRKKSFYAIQEIFNKVDKFNPEPREGLTNKDDRDLDNARIEDECNKLYDKIDQLKEGLPFNSKLQNLRKRGLYLYKKLSTLKDNKGKLKEEVTLEDVFGKRDSNFN